ncbi:histidine kinase [Burkholderia cenocepacia]|nr:histidine kinase [Burkholderia cenocepacia]
MTRRASRAPQYAHLTARAKRRGMRVAAARTRLRDACGRWVRRPPETGRRCPHRPSGRIRSPIR